MSLHSLCRAVLAAALAPLVAAGQGAGVQGWASAGLGMADRTAAVGGVVGTGTGAVPVGDGGIRLGVLSLRARFGGGEFTPDSGTAAAATLASMDVAVGGSFRWLSAEVGMGRRSLEGALTTRTWTYMLGGIRAEVPLGASGMTAGVAAHAWFGGKESGSDLTASGLAGESYLLVRPWTAPVYLRLGYRAEAFTDDGTVPFPDRISTLNLGVGLTLRSAVPGRGPSPR